MGRYSFRAQRVHENLAGLLEAGLVDRRPAWHEVVGDIRPPELLTRRRPIQHVKKTRGPRSKRPSKMFQPTEIQYPEDRLRYTFFKDHPWELARPRIVVEDSGVNGTRAYNSIQQKGQLLSGESVVQRQMYLMQNNSLTKTQAYDVARTEFYKERLRQDVERRVAREEALHYGAFFGKNRIEIGMQLEDKAFEDWKAWADKEVTAVEQLRLAGTAQPDSSSEMASSDQPTELEEVGEVDAETETLRPQT